MKGSTKACQCALEHEGNCVQCYFNSQGPFCLTHEPYAGEYDGGLFSPMGQYENDPNKIKVKRRIIKHNCGLESIEKNKI